MFMVHVCPTLPCHVLPFPALPAPPCNTPAHQDHLVVTLFLTMLVGAGGNAGNQSAIKVIRGLVRRTAQGLVSFNGKHKTISSGATLSFGTTQPAVCEYGLLAVAVRQLGTCIPWTHDVQHSCHFQ